MQIKAGLIKEWMYILRGFRFGGILLLFFGCAVLNPLTSGMMITMGDMVSEMGGVEVPGMDNVEESMDVLIGLFTPEYTLAASLGTLFTAVLLGMLLLSGMAGAEQKKRSVIIPQTAGLTPTGYVMPKFIMYPPMIFILTVLSAFVANIACEIVLDASFSFDVVLASGVLYGIWGMFAICMFLMFGICFAQPMLSVLYVVIANEIFGSMMTAAFSIDRYTPWNIRAMADNMIYENNGKLSGDVIITAAITLILCVIFLLVTLFAMNAKRMDNTADEVY